MVATGRRPPRRSRRCQRKRKLPPPSERAADRHIYGACRDPKLSTLNNQAAKCAPPSTVTSPCLDYSVSSSSGSRKDFKEKLIYHLHAMPCVASIVWASACVPRSSRRSPFKAERAARRLPLLHLNGRKAFRMGERGSEGETYAYAA